MFAFKKEDSILTVVPIHDTRFAHTLTPKNDKNVSVGTKFVTINNLEYTVERFDKKMFMLSRVYTEGFQMGKKELSFALHNNNSYPIEIPLIILNEWIKPFQERGETNQVLSEELIRNYQQ
jgi:hypothetical protein